MSIRLNRPVVISASALAIICAVGAVATAMAMSSHHVTKLHARHSAVSFRLRRVFSVFVTHNPTAHSTALGTSEQPLPSAVANILPQEVSGVNPSEAVFAGGTYPTWVVPGSSKVCLVAGATGPHSVPSSMCSPISWAEQHGLAIVTEREGRLPVILGLAPDGNSSVQVAEADGATQSVPVVNNVYEIIGGSPKSVTIRGTSGALWHRVVGMPTVPASSSGP